MTTQEVRSIGSIADRGNGMRWALRLITAGDDARCLSTDLIEICRPEGLGDIANPESILPEAKQLLASVQRAVVSGQADSHGLQRPCCPACSGKRHLKDWRGHRIGTLFGELLVAGFSDRSNSAVRRRNGGFPCRIWAPTVRRDKINRWNWLKRNFVGARVGCSQSAMSVLTQNAFRPV